MFNLEQAIQNWKRQLRSSPAFEDGDIAELESHLRDEIERLESEGLSAEEAFEKASEEIGQPENLGQELYKNRTRKVDATPSWKQKSLVPMMLPNYLKVAFRNFSKNGLYTLINIAGLSVAVGCCLLIFAYIQDELSYDNSYQNSEEIYRVSTFGAREGHSMKLAASPAPLARALVDDLPEVKTAARISRFRSYTVSSGQEKFNEEYVLFADSTFFDLFPSLLKAGNKNEVLSSPYSVVLTREMARKYFENQNPVGKTLRFGNNDYEVTGVSEDLPDNSHLRYDFLLSMSTRSNNNNDRWFSNNYYTYARLIGPEAIETVEEKMSGIVKKYVGPSLVEAMGITYDQMVASGGMYGYRFTPITDIHLYSDMEGELLPGSNPGYLYFFGVVGLLILIIASINFVNLATAQAEYRAKEVAMRKVLGSNRRQLAGQFLFESMLISMVAVLLGLLFIEFFLPFFNDLMGKDLGNYFRYSTTLLASLVIFGLGIGFLAGAYPSLLLSSFQPSKILKGGNILSESGLRWGPRSLLVVAQFAFSFLMIVTTIVIQQQLELFQSKELGFNKEQVLVIDNGYLLQKNTDVFKQALQDNPDVMNVATTNSMPGRLSSDTRFTPQGKGHDASFSMNYTTADYDFLETMDMELVAGRYFSPDYRTDSAAIVLNEAAALEAGWENPIGNQITGAGITGGKDRTFTVIGVVKDFHFESLQKTIEPYAIILNNGRGRVAVRLSDQIALQEAVSEINTVWDRFADRAPLDYYFLDRSLDELYKKEQQIGKTFGFFSVLCIIIALLGLFSLASFAMEKSRKEIGIRKVLGASIGNILSLFGLRFLKLILLAFILAAPFSFYFMNEWLQNYAYRIEIRWQIYAVTLIGILAFATVSVGYQSIKTALLDPVKSLRSE